MFRWIGRSAPCLLAFCLPILASAAQSKKDKLPAATAPVSFAPLPEDHPLASLWNDPDLPGLLGSYGFNSEVEPRMSPEEQVMYRDKVVPLLREDPKKAMPVLEGLVKPAATAVFDFTLGNVYFQTEDLTNAIIHFEGALAKFPDYRRAQKNLAFALVRSGQYAAAIKPLTRTVALGGGDGKVFGLLGFAYMNQGRAASAEAAYSQALVYEPDNADFKLGLTKAAVSAANYDRALALLDEMLAQFPQRDNLWTLQANIYIQKEQPARAAVSLEMLRRLGKATAPNLYLLGDLYMMQESRDLALTAYLEAIEKDGGQNPAKALRACQILVSRSAWEEARQLFARLRSASNQLGDADELKLLKLESKVALSSGSGAEAVKVLQQIIAKNPLDGEATPPRRGLLREERPAREGGFPLRHRQQAARVRGRRLREARSAPPPDAEVRPSGRTAAQGAENQAARERAAVPGAGRATGADRALLSSV